MQPPSAFELGDIGFEDGAKRGQVGGDRLRCSFRQGDWVRRLREEIVDGGAQEVREPGRARDGSEIGGRSAFDLAPRSPREQLAGQRARECLRIRGQLPAERGDGLDSQPQRDAASADETASELVAMAHGRHQHDRLREGVGIVSSGQT